MHTRTAATLVGLAMIVAATGCSGPPAADRTNVESSSACSTTKVVAAGWYGTDSYALGAGDQLGEAIFATWLASQDLPDSPGGPVMASTLVPDAKVTPL